MVVNYFAIDWNSVTMLIAALSFALAGFICVWRARLKCRGGDLLGFNFSCLQRDLLGSGTCWSSCSHSPENSGSARYSVRSRRSKAASSESTTLEAADELRVPVNSLYCRRTEQGEKTHSVIIATSLPTRGARCHSLPRLSPPRLTRGRGPGS